MKTPDNFNHRRRRLLQSMLGVSALGLAPQLQATTPDKALITKAIPSSGERIPVIGMGTSRTFNVGSDPRSIASRAKVLQTFFDLGGGMVDSSPMYGSAEKVLGLCLKDMKPHSSLFSATKVWTWSGDEGPDQIAESHRLWGLDSFDLYQVHNLSAWEEHLPYLYEMKAEKRLAYVGITTSHGRRHDDLEDIMRKHPLDFVQLSYNIDNLDAEQRLLPLARERGIAIIANRPFQRGDLFDEYQNQPLPPWAAEIGCHNWAQFLLKFIVSHPAVTCAIPATRRVDHMQENMGACRGELPDQAMRRRMLEYVRNL